MLVFIQKKNIKRLYFISNLLTVNFLKYAAIHVKNKISTEIVKKFYKYNSVLINKWDL